MVTNQKTFFFLASFLFQVIMYKYTCTFRCITIMLIKVHCNERFRKHFNSFRSTMKHHHQKQITKNFPLQQNGKQKKSVVLLMLKQEQLQRDHELLKMANAPKWTSIDPLHRHWKKTLWPTMNQPIPGVVDSGQWIVDSGAKWGTEENKRGRE